MIKLTMTPNSVETDKYYLGSELLMTITDPRTIPCTNELIEISGRIYIVVQITHQPALLTTIYKLHIHIASQD